MELYLPNGFTFRFLLHPGYPSNSYSVENVQRIEIGNDMHSWEIDRAIVQEVAVLLGHLLNSSDAHSLSDIGRY